MIIEPELLGLLRACKEGIDDDAPRLILADWLQERGDARGDLVRVQVERHRLPPWDVRQAALARRESELLRRHRAEWLGPLTDWCDSVTFRRGLLAASIDRVAPEIEPSSEAWAWVEHLSIREAPPRRRWSSPPRAASARSVWGIGTTTTALGRAS